MKRVFAFGLTMILAVCLILSTLTGCVLNLGKSEDPYLEDRTAGWEPRLMYNAEFDVEDLDADSGELWNSIIEFKPYCYGQRITSVNFGNAAAEVLKLYLGDANSELSTRYKLRNTDGIIGTINKDFAIAFDAGSGKLMFFADLKNSPMLKVQYEKLCVTLDLAKLNARQLKELQAINGMRITREPDMSTASLPLTAEGAYNLSLSMQIKRWGGSTPLAATGGAFKVYYSENSDALFVVTNTYIQAFAVDNGDLLSLYYCTSDKYGTDESVQRDVG